MLADAHLVLHDVLLPASFGTRLEPQLPQGNALRWYERLTSQRCVGRSPDSKESFSIT